MVGTGEEHPPSRIQDQASVSAVSMQNDLQEFQEALDVGEAVVCLFGESTVRIVDDADTGEPGVTGGEDVVARVADSKTPSCIDPEPAHRLADGLSRRLVKARIAGQDHVEAKVETVE
jgi:hypothetical protein